MRAGASVLGPSVLLCHDLLCHQAREYLLAVPLVPRVADVFRQCDACGLLLALQMSPHGLAAIADQQRSWAEACLVVSLPAVLAPLHIAAAPRRHDLAISPMLSHMKSLSH